MGKILDIKPVLLVGVSIISGCSTTRDITPGSEGHITTGSYIHDAVGPPSPVAGVKEETVIEQSEDPCVRFHLLAHWSCKHPAIASAILMIGIVGILSYAADHSGQHHGEQPKHCGYVPNINIVTGKPYDGDPVIWRCIY